MRKREGGGVREREGEGDRGQPKVHRGGLSCAVEYESATFGGAPPAVPVFILGVAV